jgi:hypothetical protein
MLKKLIGESQKVMLVDGNSEPIPAFLAAGKIFDQEQNYEILTDGESRLISGNELEIYDYHWLIFQNSEAMKKAEIDKKWLEAVNVTDIGFIDLCLALEVPGVIEIKFNSDREDFIDSHLTPIISNFSMNGIPPGEYWLALFDNHNTPLSAAKITIVPDSNFSMANSSLGLYNTKGYLVKV